MVNIFSSRGVRTAGRRCKQPAVLTPAPPAAQFPPHGPFGRAQLLKHFIQVSVVLLDILQRREDSYTSKRRLDFLRVTFEDKGALSKPPHE